MHDTSHNTRNIDEQAEEKAENLSNKNVSYIHRLLEFCHRCPGALFAVLG
jgi:hypothetical protein